MDKSIEIEPTENQVEVSLIKIESIFQYVTPVQVLTENKEVD